MGISERFRLEFEMLHLKNICPIKRMCRLRGGASLDPVQVGEQAFPSLACGSHIAKDS